MGILTKRAAARRTKALGDPGNDFGGALSMIFGDGNLPNARSTEELLGASASTTWAHLGGALKSAQFAATRYGLTIPTAKTTGSDGRANAEWGNLKSRLEVPVNNAGSVKGRASLFADLKATGFIQEAQSHPFLTMISQGSMWAPNVNFQFNGYELCVLMSKTVEAVGEAFFVLDRDSSGMARRMLMLPPHWVTRPFERSSLGQIQNPDNPTGNYRVSRIDLAGARSPVGEIDPRDMVAIRVANPREPFRRGSGDLDALDAPIATDDSAAATTSARFRNNGVPALLFMMAGLSSPESKALDHEWKRDLQGSLKAGLTKFMTLPKSFKIKDQLMIKELQSSVVDMDVANLRTLLRDELLLGQRIPPLLAGEQSSGNRAMALVAAKLFDMNAVVPFRELMRAVWQARLFEPVADQPAEYEGGFLVTWAAPDQTDEDTRDRLVSNIHWHFSRAQALRFSGETPAEGDEDIYAIPNTMTLWNQRTQQNVGPEPPPAQPFGAAQFEESSAKMAVSLAEVRDALRQLEAMAA